MKIILIGHPGSQYIVPASRYLINKYMPGFDLHFLNWTGPKEGWSSYLSDYLKELNDELVILALDDYLLSKPYSLWAYREGIDTLKDDKNIACVKLCRTTLEEHLEYPVTTQFMFWKREFLIDLLSKTKDPWHFEITGSQLFRESGMKSVCTRIPAVNYDAHSCLSARWSGINWGDVKQEDIDYIKNNNLIL